MRRICRNCLCRICIDSCHCGNCKGKIKECKRYSGFRQLGIFRASPEPEYKAAPRHPLGYYGLTDERAAELGNLVRSGRYASIAYQAAHAANKDIAEHIIKSIVENKSYDKIEYDSELGRIPCCRTDFYGYRREFYSIFDRELRRLENEANNI